MEALFCALLQTCICALLRSFARFGVFLRLTAFRTTAFGRSQKNCRVFSTRCRDFGFKIRRRPLSLQRKSQLQSQAAPATTVHSGCEWPCSTQKSLARQNRKIPSCFGHLLVTLLSLFCLPPFASPLLRQGDPRFYGSNRQNSRRKPKEWVLGSEIAAQNRKSLAIFHRTLESQCNIALLCLRTRWRLPRASINPKYCAPSSPLPSIFPPVLPLHSPFFLPSFLLPSPLFLPHSCPLCASFSGGRAQKGEKIHFGKPIFL